MLSDRTLTLSEDLPLVWGAVGGPGRIEALAEAIGDLIPQGLVTMERCTIIDVPRLPDGDDDEQVKVTLTVGRGHKVRGRLCYVRLVEHLFRCGVDGAFVVLGVDGITDGVRRRARLIGSNADVPAQVVAIGTRRQLARAMAGLHALGGPSLTTAERADVWMRDGVVYEDRAADRVPHALSQHEVWQKITLITREDARASSGAALYLAAMQRAQAAGVRGGTAFMGVWGYAGAVRPHGDRMVQVRRSVPVVCTFIDEPAAIRSFKPALRDLAANGGLITSEWVPAFRAHGPHGVHGALDLGRR